jgi:hypothetical protein
MRVRRWVRIEDVDTDDLVVGAGSEVLVVGGKADSVDCARVCAYGGELFWLCVLRVVRVEDGVCRPYANVCI